MRKIRTPLLASLLVLSMSVTAFAEPPQTVIGADGNGTSITITDITPREDEENEQKAERKTNYKVGSFYPIEIQTAEEDRIRLLVKTFLVPQGTDPAALVEEGMTRGVAHFAYKTALRERQYAVSKIREIPQDNWDYLMRTEDKRLTLITCITGKPDSRLMVQAVEA
ncbi:sortase [Anaerotruncus colihominis]|uniref:Sortase n=1 Tax=Anaerotruncus colihominis DSM 17241 TaxID=445972 RepID=B0PBY6_9FIRM|nr:sortase [Anaerotruncus colihominis]EDS11111.1 hypothetical protein ANACOL_02295 [Anaerotruncus colihominis DSM 17241]UOX66908.1 sortase [Anaerotruncus colihominis]